MHREPDRFDLVMCHDHLEPPDDIAIYAGHLPRDGIHRVTDPPESVV